MGALPGLAPLPRFEFALFFFPVGWQTGYSVSHQTLASFSQCLVEFWFGGALGLRCFVCSSAVRAVFLVLWHGTYEFSVACCFLLRWCIGWYIYSYGYVAYLCRVCLGVV